MCMKSSTGSGMPRRAPEAHALGAVREDRVGRDVGIERVVRRRLAGVQVLDVVLRRRRLAEVVVVGADAREQRVGADRRRCQLGHVGHRQRVRPGARRLLGDALEQRMVEIGQLDELAARAPRRARARAAAPRRSASRPAASAATDGAEDARRHDRRGVLVGQPAAHEEVERQIADARRAAPPPSPARHQAPPLARPAAGT